MAWPYFLSSTFICSFTFLTTFLYQREKCVAAASLPIVIQTWPWPSASKKAISVLLSGGSAVDSVETGCHECELHPCASSVGYGGSPDESGETRLDAMIMDGNGHRVGAVASLGRVKNAVGVARAVMDYSEHTLLVGDRATNFAKEMGFKIENLSTNKSVSMWKEWKDSNCQPNFRRDVSPDPSTHCGPYKPNTNLKATNKNFTRSRRSHDTLGMVAIDSQGQIAAATTTNGATFKIPGRVGDSPIPGSGCYVDAGVGGAAATGDGDILMRFLPSYQAVEGMRQGRSPQEAAQHALDRVSEHYKHYEGAVIAITNTGRHGAACRGFTDFTYCVASANMTDVKQIPVTCTP